MRDTMTGKGASASAPTEVTEHSGTPSPATTPGGIGTKAGHEAAPLFPRDESDTFELKLQHAVSGFVDAPRAAVEEADHVLEELTARLNEAMTRRRRTLRGAWQAEGGPESSTDTEQLRLALRDYRELAERLLHV